MGVGQLDRGRWLAVVGLCAVTAALGLVACGGSSSTGSSHHSTSTPASSSSPGSSASGSSGERIFTSAGCAGCHTLAAAHATGSVGPNLDQLKPSYAAVVSQVDNGGGAMPSFAGKLSTTQIDAVAKFVASATH